MEYAEFVKTAVAKSLATKDELEKVHKEHMDDLVSKGIPKENADLMAQRKVMGWLKKEMRSALTEYQLIIFGVTKPTDFNVSGMWQEGKELWEKNPQEAIRLGYTNSAGEPVYHGDSYEKDSRKGTPINLDTVWKRNVYALARKKTDAGDFEEWKEAKVSLQYDLCKHDTVIPKFCISTAELFQNEKSTPEMYDLSSRVGKTQFNVVDEKYVNFSELMKKYLKHRMVAVGKLDKWVQTFKDDRTKYFISQPFEVNEIRIGQKENNTIFFTKEESSVFDEGDSSVIQGFYPKFHQIEFTEQTCDPIIVGTGFITQDSSEPRLNLWGVWVPEVERVIQRAKPITANTGKTTEVKNKKEVVDTGEVVSPEDENWEKQ